MQTYSKRQTNRLVRLGLFFALILVQSWVPFLGYIHIPPLSITYIHITVIVATLWLGAKDGAIVGTFWGLNSWLVALMMPTSPLQRFVLSSPLISVLPRFLMPMMIGYLYHVLPQRLKQSKWSAFFLGGLGSLLNTVLVLGFIGLFKADLSMSIMGATTNGALWAILGGIVMVNGIPEMIFSAIVTPLLLGALQTSQKRR